MGTLAGKGYELAWTGTGGLGWKYEGWYCCDGAGSELCIGNPGREEPEPGPLLEESGGGANANGEAEVGGDGG